MKHLFFVILILPVLLSYGPAARSQSVPPKYADTLAKLKAASPEQRAQLQSDLMRSRLQLTDVQYKQTSAINLNYARKIEPILRSDESRFSKYRKIKPLLDKKDEMLKGKELMDQGRKAMNS